MSCSGLGCSLLDRVINQISQIMEDFRAAFEQRNQDTEALYSSERRVAAMHFGGIAVECLLKSLILASLPKHAQREWKIGSNAPVTIILTQATVSKRLWNVIRP